MNKVFFSSAALLILLTTAFAQNTATLSQLGTAQTAAQTQTGDHQVSVIAQIQADGPNIGNWAATNQTGTLLNTALISQNNGSQHSRAMVTQDGAGQRAQIDQVGEAYHNEAMIYQTGIGNIGYVFQQHISKENVATLTQRGVGNEAELQQQTQARGNTIVVTQSGTNGYVFVRQSYNEVSASATVQQDGTRNEAELYQQTGNGNTATIDQQTAGSDNYAFVYQGDSFAYSGSSGPANDNITFLGQRGSGNMAQLWTMGNHNTFTVEQTGNGNIVRGIIGGQFSFDHIGKQLGDDNTLTVNQISLADGLGHLARIQQMGLFNSATVVQTSN